jgi:hypothetical protein
MDHNTIQRNTEFGPLDGFMRDEFQREHIGTYNDKVGESIGDGINAAEYVVITKNANDYSVNLGHVEYRVCRLKQVRKQCKQTMPAEKRDSPNICVSDVLFVVLTICCFIRMATRRNNAALILLYCITLLVSFATAANVVISVRTICCLEILCIPVDVFTLAIIGHNTNVIHW